MSKLRRKSRLVRLAQAGAYWHATQKGRQAVAAGIRLYTETMLPSVQAGAGEDLLGPDDPETLGRASARHYRQLKQYHPDPISSQNEDRIVKDGRWVKR